MPWFDRETRLLFLVPGDSPMMITSVSAQMPSWIAGNDSLEPRSGRSDDHQRQPLGARPASARQQTVAVPLAVPLGVPL